VKNFKLLAVVVILAIVALLLQQGKKPAGSTDPLVGQNLISALEIDQVRELSLKTAQSQLELKMVQDKWRLMNLHQFQADANKIEELFQRLNSAKLIEMVSKNPQRHASMGVASSADAISDDEARLILKNASGQNIKDVFLGKGRQAKNVDGSQGWGNDGQYCRFADNDAVYLLSTFLWLEKNQKNWLGKQLLQIAADKIQKLAWSYPEQEKEEFEIARAVASEGMVLNKLSEDQQTKKTVADAAMRVFENLAFDDFIATDSPELHPAFADHLSLWLECFDGFKVSMRLSSGPVELPGLGKMSLLWLTAEYAGADASLRATADEIASYSHKFVFALREHKLKPVLIKSGNLIEAKPKPVDQNASATAEVSDLQKVSASHILVAYKGAERSKAERSEDDAKKLVEELLAKIKKGESFEKLAEENSDCPSGKAQKGSLGEFGRGVMAKEFENSAFSLKVGEISGVVKTAFGYHIIRRDK
jgi:hypothetical protein